MNNTDTILRRLVPADWPEVRKIYAEGIATGQATFETDIPQWETWDKGHLSIGRCLAESAGRVLGWAALSPISDRCAYRGVAEVSVYVAEKARGMGIGKMLLNQLITQAEDNGFWTLQAGMFPENEASVGLHQKCGFRIVGKRERLGKLNGYWRDVLLLERRSSKTGI